MSQRIFSVFWPPPLLSLFGWPPSSTVRADTNFGRWCGIFKKSNSKYPYLSPLPHAHSTNTKKVSHKVKYLLTTLIQDENRERINIYLKISYRNEKNSICFKEPIYCPVEHINVFSWLLTCGVFRAPFPRNTSVCLLLKFTMNCNVN